MLQAENELKYAKILQERAEGVQEGIRRVKRLLEKNKVEVPPDVAKLIFDEPMNYDEPEEGMTWAARWRGKFKPANLEGDPRYDALAKKHLQ